ncbi:MAG: hypothetical protein Q9218_002928 [Villophora microphyllina]
MQNWDEYNATHGRNMSSTRAVNLLEASYCQENSRPKFSTFASVFAESRYINGKGTPWNWKTKFNNQVKTIFDLEADQRKDGLAKSKLQEELSRKTDEASALAARIQELEEQLSNKREAKVKASTPSKLARPCSERGPSTKSSSANSTYDEAEQQARRNGPAVIHTLYRFFEMADLSTEPPVHLTCVFSVCVDSGNTTHRIHWHHIDRDGIVSYQARCLKGAMLDEDEQIYRIRASLAPSSAVEQQHKKLVYVKFATFFSAGKFHQCQTKGLGATESAQGYRDSNTYNFKYHRGNSSISLDLQEACSPAFQDGDQRYAVHPRPAPSIQSIMQSTQNSVNSIRQEPLTAENLMRHTAPLAGDVGLLARETTANWLASSSRAAACFREHIVQQKQVVKSKKPGLLTGNPESWGQPPNHFNYPAATPTPGQRI